MARGGAALLALLMRGARPQYTVDDLKYDEEIAEQTALLKEEIKSAANVEDHFYPWRQYFDRDIYTFNPPHPQLYTIGLLVDPCKGADYDCCDNTYGSPVYLRVQRELVDLGDRQATASFNHLLLAEPDEILANCDLVNADGEDVSAAIRRRADDESYIDESCDGVRVGVSGSVDSNGYPYRLNSDGQLERVDAFTHCQGSRLGNRQYSLKPRCSDNNGTVNAELSCTSLDGSVSPNCVQVAFTQTAVIVSCGASVSANFEDFSDNSHCGTFIEIHREGGSPYEPDENLIIAEKRIDTTTVSGYTTTTMSLTYAGNASRILCNYEETVIRLGSMVFITDSAPECCCPNSYNNDKKTGKFFCPVNSYEDTSGPYANSLSSLDHFLNYDVVVDEYPYCPVLPADVDQMQCSTNYTTAGGVKRYYNYACPDALNENKSAVCSETAPCSSAHLVGEEYSKQCFFWAGCVGSPSRAGDWAAGASSFSGVDSNNGGCAYEGLEAAADKDMLFTFKGLVGKVVCIPTEDSSCVPDDDRYEDDATYYNVTFNDNRTSYAFRVADLELHMPRHNYQLWWVQRTRTQFIIQKKKALRVSAPTCTFDEINDRYFPYAMVDSDGVLIETF